MSCSLKHCKVVDPKELHVRCWICHDEYHAKCVELNARVVDALQDRKGIRWSCKKCSAVEIDFASLFKHFRSAFVELNKDFQGLHTKLAKYEESFNNFKVLNLPDASPKRKKTLRSHKNKGTVSDNGNLDAITLDPVCEESRQMAVDEPAPVSASILVKPLETYSSILSASSPLPSSSASCTLTAPKNLVIVAPKKSIFVSRFASDTSEDDILFFINTKKPHLKDITISKFKFNRERYLASFKIYVPADSFDELVAADFWPKNTVVHEFVHKPSKVVRLESRSSKN